MKKRRNGTNAQIDLGKKPDIDASLSEMKEDRLTSYNEAIKKYKKWLKK
ncbi:MAG: hypothetical protein QM763_00320 [Agriterribacter sp.]